LSSDEHLEIVGYGTFQPWFYILALI
jgi:hypothetical protein